MCYHEPMALAENSKARFNYEILKSFDAGIELFGHEVKALKTGKGALLGSHVVVRGGEAFLVGASIAPYQSGNVPENYDAERARKLLLTKGELQGLADAEGTKGLTIVALKVYNKGNRLKLQVGIARGKKQYDKRHSIKKRDMERELGRTLKR